MYKTRPLIVLFASAVIFTCACAPSKAPGTWVLLDTGTGDAFSSVNFVDENVGWLNGHTDRSFKDPEGNENANKRPKKPAQKQEDPLQANQGFEVLQTTDGGQTWRQIPDQFKHKIRSVWFVDPQRGWALTIDRDILHTTDGGATWTNQRKAATVQLKIPRQPVQNVPEQIENIHFVDGLHGWAWGGGQKDDQAEQPGILLTTVNGGQNWNLVPYPFEQQLWGIFFLDAQHAWASSMEGALYKSTDGGLNWAKIQTKLPEDVFRAIQFIDESNGWVVGRSGRLAKTTDGGRTWVKMYKIKDQFVMRDIFFTDRNHGWVVGKDGAILYTPDAGDTWVDASAPVAAQFMDLVFVSKNAGWAVGLSGAVMRYEPGSSGQ